MADRGLFLGRGDELRRWRGVLQDARASASGDGRGSFVVLVHGIGGMGKSRLVRRLCDLVDERGGTGKGAVARVLVDLESERDRLPDRYPPFEGPSVGTLLYTIERAVCGELGERAERSFAAFRSTLGQIIKLVGDAERLELEAKQAGRGLSGEERKGLQDAATVVAGLAGAAIVGSLVGAGVAAAGPVSRLLRRVRKGAGERAAPQVSQRRLDLALDAEGELVRDFVAGVRAACGERGVVIAIDTGEIALRALAAVREAARVGPSSVVWLVAGRFETPAEAGYATSAVGEFERAISADRLAIVAISVFDRGLQREYLHARLAPRVLDDEDLLRVDRATRGIPLGLSLVADMLCDGVDPGQLDAVIDERGEANLLIQGLARRFLHHALTLAPDKPNVLRDDLPAIFGLVADETAGAGAIIGYPLQRTIRAALLDVGVAALGARVDELASRHDFVVAATGQVHQEVASAVASYMLGADQRDGCAAMHERALAVITDALATSYADMPIGARVADEAWRLLATAYVSHALWIANERGIEALCAILPAAHVLHPELASTLRACATRFYETASSDERRVLRGLPWPKPSFLDEWLERRQAGATPARARLPRGDAEDAQQADRVLARDRPAVAGLTADATATRVLTQLLQADATSDASSSPVVHLARADQLLADGDLALSTALGQRARRAASQLIFSGPGGFARHDPDGLLAAQIAARRLPDDPGAGATYAVALRHAGSADDADTAYQRALAADPDHATILGNYALFLTTVRGEHDRAEEHYKRALTADPDHANHLGNYARLLLERGDDAEAATLVRKAFEHAQEHHDPLRAELWTYRYALGPGEDRERALKELSRLLLAGVRSPRWDFSRIVARAIAQRHPEADHLPTLADVVSDRLRVSALAGWTAWPPR